MNTFLLLSILFMSLAIMLGLITKASSSRVATIEPTQTSAKSTGDIDLDLKRIDSEMEQIVQEDFDPNLVTDTQIGL